jgi:hypothetical protein
MKHMIPDELRAAETKRLASKKFKYTMMGPSDSLMEVDTLPHSSDRSRKREWSPQQETLDRFWGPDAPRRNPSEGSTKKRRTAEGSADESLPGPSGSDPEAVVATPSNVIDSRDVIYAPEEPGPLVAELAEPPLVDLSVSCRSTNPSLPRRPTPTGAFSWLVSWGYNPRVGLYFEQKLAPDFKKTSFCNRRGLVSRKRTTNVFDLASAWRKAKNNQAALEDPLLGAVL